jgi:hypothetical protein
MSSTSRLFLLAILAAALVVSRIVVVAMRRADDSGHAAALGKMSVTESPTTASETADNLPTGFREVASECGLDFRMTFLPNEQGEKFKINLYDHGCGVVVGDYNGDGHDDIYFLNQLGPNALFENRGNGTFVNVTKAAGVGLDDRISVGGAFADYDNDGDQDLYVTSTRGGNVLFQNQGNGTFRDVTEASQLTWVGHSQTATFFDYDNDGFLDLFVCNSAQWTLDTYDDTGRYYVGPPDLAELASSPKEQNILYHNNRNGTFSDVSEEAGVQGNGWAGDVAVADYDEDGLLDLFVSNMFGIGHLYHNEGSGEFRDVGKDVFGRTSWGMAGCRFFDFNNDGRFDLFITDMHSDMWMPPADNPTLSKMIANTESRKYKLVSGPTQEFDPRNLNVEMEFVDRFRIRYEDVLFGNTLFKNLGGGRFEECSERAKMETFWPWGIATGDFENNGFEDVFIPSGMGFPFFYWRNYLMMNNGDETFSDRSRTEGIEPPPRGQFLEQKIGDRPAARSSRCAATADFDGDGRLEIVVNNFNDYPYYFRNEFPDRHYVAFQLKGTKSNRDAIGAVVRLTAGDKVMTRQVQAAGGYLSQSSKIVHFGLGDDSKVDSVEVRWPSGIRQKIDNVQVGTLQEIVEPDE